MKFCPRCKSMLIPTRKGSKQILKCSKCGYEEELTENTRNEYMSKRVIAEDKHRMIAIDRTEERKLTSEERELLEDYHKQLLENLYEAERESEEE